MDEHIPFLESIREDPYSDLPRLIYADWLDEVGLPQAQLVRLQCRLAREEGAFTHERLQREANALLKKMPPYPWLRPVTQTRWQSHRGVAQGFQAELCTLEVATLEEILTCSWEWNIVINRFAIPAPERFQQADLSRLRALHFPPASLQDIPLTQALADNTSLSGLRELTTSVGIAQFFTRVDLSNLRSLTLYRDNRRGLRHTDWLANLPLQRVDVLDLSGCNATADELNIFAKSPLLEGLRAVGLAGCEVNRKFLEQLAESSPNLEVLDLRNAKLDYYDADPVMDEKTFPKLRRVAATRTKGSPLKSRLAWRFGSNGRYVPQPSRSPKNDYTQQWARFVRFWLSDA